MSADQLPFQVADLSLASFGRKEIQLAEHEMPGLMAVPAEYAPSQPLRGARITGSLHMTIQTAVLIETLTALGAQSLGKLQHLLHPGPRGRGRRHRAGRHPRRPAGHPGLRLEGGDPRGVLALHRAGADLAGRGRCRRRPNMILDDGGDATLFVHKGAEYEQAGGVPSPSEDDAEEWVIILDRLRNSLADHPGKWTQAARNIKGVTEETTTGVHRLYEMARAGTLLFPAINVNDSVTKSKFDNKYGSGTRSSTASSAAPTSSSAARSRWSAATATWARAVRKASAARARGSS